MALPKWSKEDVAVVTGANRGLGFGIVQLLAEQGLTVILTARDESKGKAAANDLHANGLKTVDFHPLDPSDSKSVEVFAAWVKREYGGIDILVNNAAISATDSTYEQAKLVLDTNFYGVKNLTASLLPLFKSSSNGARIVNITSRAGLYETLQSESLKDKFRDEDNYSEKLADSLAEKLLNDYKSGQAEKEGWIQNGPGKMPLYSESKMFLNVYSNALAGSLAKSRTEGNEIFVASICPGVTLTDALKDLLEKGFKLPEGFPTKSVAEGADTAIWLALLPKAEWNGKLGRLFGERAEYPFGWKNPPGSAE